MPNKRCIYCGLEKDESNFSLEHIWPDALGGDFLEEFWKTEEVCQRCNSLSGVFVDGAFIKSWMGSAERTQGIREYLSLERPSKGAFPLHYMGVLPDVVTQVGETVEFWLGPCGEHILHFRPEDSEDLWASYAGGDPRKGSKKSKAGRAYLTFTSKKEFWFLVTLASFKFHFKGDRYIVNAEIPAKWTAFKTPDPADPIQAADLAVVNSIRQAADKGESVHAQPRIRLDLSHRLLAKLGLAVGYKMIGQDFLDTDYAKSLRQGFREADFQKRSQIPIKGTGYFGGNVFGGAEMMLRWPGAWVLMIHAVQNNIALSIITPSGKSMTILVCEDAALVDRLDEAVTDGRVWITVPALGEAFGPISFPEYLAHQTGNTSVPVLASLAAKRADPASLPPCHD